MKDCSYVCRSVVFLESEEADNLMLVSSVVEAGDILVYLHGCMFPFVLRLIDEQESVYEFLGPAIWARRVHNNDPALDASEQKVGGAALLQRMGKLYQKYLDLHRKYHPETFKLF